MKTIGVSALRPKSRAAESIPLQRVNMFWLPIGVRPFRWRSFNADLLQAGVHVSLAIRLFEDGTLSLAKAAKLAKMPVESFAVPWQTGNCRCRPKRRRIGRRFENPFATKPLIVADTGQLIALAITGCFPSFICFFLRFMFPMPSQTKPL